MVRVSYAHDRGTVLVVLVVAVVVLVGMAVDMLQIHMVVEATVEVEVPTLAVEVTLVVVDTTMVGTVV
jgi:hypothetical protein